MRVRRKHRSLIRDARLQSDISTCAGNADAGSVTMLLPAMCSLPLLLYREKLADEDLVMLEDIYAPLANLVTMLVAIAAAVQADQEGDTATLAYALLGDALPVVQERSWPFDRRNGVAGPNRRTRALFLIRPEFVANAAASAMSRFPLHPAVSPAE